MYKYLKYKIKYLKLKGGAAAADDICTGLIGCQCKSCLADDVCTSEPDCPCAICSNNREEALEREKALIEKKFEVPEDNPLFVSNRISMLPSVVKNLFIEFAGDDKSFLLDKSTTSTHPYKNLDIKLDKKYDFGAIQELLQKPQVICNMLVGENKRYCQSYLTKKKIIDVYKKIFGELPKNHPYNKSPKFKFTKETLSDMLGHSVTYEYKGQETIKDIRELQHYIKELMGIDRYFIPEGIKLDVDVVFKNITIPDFTDEIKARAFYRCQTEVIDIPPSVKKIGNYAFFGNRLLEKIKIPSSVKIIEEYLFSNCIKLNEVIIEDGVEEIKYYAFHDNMLSNIIIPLSVTSIGNYAFSKCRLENIIIGRQIKKLGKGAFSHNPLIKNVVIPSSIVNIPSSLFSNCGLENVIIEDGITAIGNDAFANNNLLKTIIIPLSVTEIGDNAFSGCGLENIIIGRQIKKMGFGVFSNNFLLKNVEIPSSIVKITHSMFYNCRLLENVIIEDGIKIIGHRVFANNISLKNIIIPSSVTEIESYAFDGNTSLKTIRIPLSVNKIHQFAFSNCGLETVYIENPNIYIEENAFINNPIQKIHLPKSINMYEFFNNSKKIFGKYHEYASGTIAWL